MLNRRDAFRGLALTMGMVSVGFAGPVAAALPPLAWTPAALDAEQARALDAAAELIVPKTDTRARARPRSRSSSTGRSPPIWTSRRPSC